MNGVCVRTTAKTTGRRRRRGLGLGATDNVKAIAECDCAFLDHDEVHA